MDMEPGPLTAAVGLLKKSMCGPPPAPLFNRNFFFCFVRALSTYAYILFFCISHPPNIFFLIPQTQATKAPKRWSLAVAEC